MKSMKMKYYIQCIGLILIVINSSMRLFFDYSPPRALSYSIVVIVAIYLYLTFKSGLTSFYLLFKSRSDKQL